VVRLDNRAKHKKEANPSNYGGTRVEPKLRPRRLPRADVSNSIAELPRPWEGQFSEIVATKPEMLEHH
jgi:hypothetical protein